MRSLDATPDLQADAVVDPQVLREWGERAASMFVNDGTPLADAVARVLESGGRSFNKYHVQRTVEYANLRAFRALRQPGPGEIGKVVSFPQGPATAVAVLGRLRHATPPDAESKSAAREDKNMGALEHLVFQPSVGARAGAMAKVASAAAAADLCGSEAYGLMLDMRAASADCQARAQNTSTKLAAVAGALCQHAAHALRHGASLADVQAVLAVGAHERPELLKHAMDIIIARAAPAAGLMGEEGDASLAKRASVGQPNPKHPLAVKMAEFVALSDALDIQRRSADILDAERRGLYRRLTAAGE